MNRFVPPLLDLSRARIIRLLPGNEQYGSMSDDLEMLASDCKRGAATILNVPVHFGGRFSRAQRFLMNGQQHVVDANMLQNAHELVNASIEFHRLIVPRAMFMQLAYEAARRCDHSVCFDKLTYLEAEQKVERAVPLRKLCEWMAFGKEHTLSYTKVQGQILALLSKMWPTMRHYVSCDEEFRVISRAAEYCMASYQMTGEKATHLYSCSSAAERQNILQTSAFVFRGGTFQYPVLKLLYCQSTISYYTEYARLLFGLLRMYETSVLDFWSNMEVYSVDETLDLESSDDDDDDDDDDDAGSLTLSFTDSSGDDSDSSGDEGDTSGDESDSPGDESDSSDGESDEVVRKRARHDDDCE